MKLKFNLTFMPLILISLACTRSQAAQRKQRKETLATFTTKDPIEIIALNKAKIAILSTLNFIPGTRDPYGQNLRVSMMFMVIPLRSRRQLDPGPSPWLQ